MALLAFWAAPTDEDVDRIEVHRASSVGGSYALVTSLVARDPYDNWVTHYLDESGTDGDYYKASFFEDGVLVGTSTARAGQTPYQVTPQMVLDTIQGLPQNSVAALMTQLRIQWAVEWVQKQIRQVLSPTTITKEIYDRTAFRKIVGSQIGYQLQLRNFPVTSVEAIYYRLRTGGNLVDTELTGLDVVIEGHNGITGYNHGVITVYPTYTSFANIFAGPLGHMLDPGDVNVKISYTAGYPTGQWPDGLEEMITKIAAADVMEIAGEAETAGLSMRSIDGYSESYTASATTTIFSARRIMYQDQVKELVKLHRKPLWG